MHHNFPGKPCFKGMRIVGMVVLGAFGAVVFGFLFGYFVELLWNWLMPELFGLGKITYWQGFGIVLLARLVFGNIGPHGGHRHHHGPHHHRPWHNHVKGHDWKNDEWKINGGWKDWRYYDDWWRAEGKAAFEGYIERAKSEEK